MEVACSLRRYRVPAACVGGAAGVPRAVVRSTRRTVPGRGVVACGGGRAGRDERGAVPRVQRSGGCAARCAVGVLCAWRPYTTLFSLVYNVLTTALTCVSVAAQLAFVVTSLTSTSGLWLVDASAVCNLLVLGLSIVKMLLDAWELWSAVKRRIHGLCAAEEFLSDDINSFEILVTNHRAEVGERDVSDDKDDFECPMMNGAATGYRGEPTSLPAVSSMFSDFFVFVSIGTSHAEELNQILSPAVEYSIGTSGNDQDLEERQFFFGVSLFA